MKNIKKLLALALVLVLALGMVPFVAASGPADMNVTDYSDFDAIEYKEAVDVLTALGVLQGDQGIFRPTDTITRAEASKIIAYVNLGTGTADALLPASTGFDDVPASHWASSFIAYCVSKGILAGYGDGNFGPEDNVTAVQMGKMLLMSVGYGVNGEFEGSGWELSVIDRARHVEVRILTETGEGVNYAAAATREEVAQYTFNTLTIPLLVSWNSTLNDYSSWGTEDQWGTRPTLGRDTFRLFPQWDLDGLGFEGIIWTQRQIGSLSARTLTEFYVYDRVIGISRANEAIRDIPGSTTRGITSVGSPVFISRLVYTTGQFVGREASTALAGFENGAGGLSYFINGNPATWEQIQGDGSNINLIQGNPLNPVLDDDDNPIGRSFARGTVVHLVDSWPYDGHADKVVIVDKTPNIVTVMPTTNAQGVTTFIGVTNTAGGNTFETRGGEPSIVYPGDIAIDDVILYYTDRTDTTFVEKANPVAGVSMESRGFAPARATFDGVTYFGSGLMPQQSYNISFNNQFETYTTEQGNLNIAATVWLDEGNGVLAVYPDDHVAPDYLVVLGTSQAGFTTQARVVLDGRVQTINVNGLIHSSGANRDNTNSGFNNTWIIGADSIYHNQAGATDGASGGSAGFGNAIGSVNPRSLFDGPNFGPLGRSYGFEADTNLDPRIYAYTEDANGNFTLIRPSTRQNVVPTATPFSASNRNRVFAFDYDDSVDLSLRTIRQAANFITIPDVAGGAGTGIVGDEHTIFVVRDWNTSTRAPLYRTYRGVANAPVFGEGTPLYAGTVVTYTNNAMVERARFVFLVGTPETLDTNVVFFPNITNFTRGGTAAAPTFTHTIIDTEATGAQLTTTITLNNDAHDVLIGAGGVERLGLLPGMPNNNDTRSRLADITFVGDLVTSVAFPPNGVQGYGSEGVRQNVIEIGAGATPAGLAGPLSAGLAPVAAVNAGDWIIDPSAQVWEVRDAYATINSGDIRMIGENRFDDAFFAVLGEPGSSTEFIIEQLYIVRWDLTVPGEGGGGAEGNEALAEFADIPLTRKNLASAEDPGDFYVTGASGARRIVIVTGTGNVEISINEALYSLLYSMGIDDEFEVDEDGLVSIIETDAVRTLALNSTVVAPTLTIAAGAALTLTGSANTVALSGAYAINASGLDATITTAAAGITNLDIGANTANIVHSVTAVTVNGGTVNVSPAATVVTTLNASGNVTVSGAAANNIASIVPATGSSITMDRAFGFNISAFVEDDSFSFTVTANTAVLYIVAVIVADAVTTWDIGGVDLESSAGTATVSGDASNEASFEVTSSAAVDANPVGVNGTTFSINPGNGVTITIERVADTT